MKSEKKTWVAPRLDALEIQDTLSGAVYTVFETEYANTPNVPLNLQGTPFGHS